NNFRLTATWQWLARESLRMSTNRIDDDLAALLARQAMLLHARTGDPHQNLVEDALQHMAQFFYNHKVVSGLKSTLAFSADGRRIAFADDTGVHVWDNDKPVAPTPALPESGARSTSMAFSADAILLAAGDIVNTVRIWNLQKPEARPTTLFGEFRGD